MTYSIRAVLVTVLMLGLLAASGCAVPHYKTMSPEQQAAIRRVSIASSVTLPENPRVFGPSANAGGLFFGPLALAAAASSDNPDSQALKKLFADKKIDLGMIVREEFIARLAQVRAFPSVDVANGDARFELSVENYGLGAAGFTPLSPINNPLIPTLRLAAKLTTGNGEVVWQNAAYLAGMDDRIEGHLFAEILADADRTREAFRKAAEIVAKDLLRDFNAHPDTAN
jgi:hypothetical protein